MSDGLIFCEITTSILMNMDIRSQIFTTTGLLILEWTDERLKWRPEEHNDMKEIIIEIKNLWRPEFAVINGAEKIYDEYNQFRAVVSYAGIVHWEPGGVFATMCSVNITFYPFDRQMCELKFGAWSYHTDKMNLTLPTTEVNLENYKENGEWEIEGSKAQRSEFSYTCCPGQKFSNTIYTIYLRRRHLFYVMNVIMPSIMTSILLLSIFFCTPAQKVQIGVVVLLSFRIFLLNVAGNIPKTSDNIPLLVVYLTCTLAITTMSMVLTVLVLNLYGIADRPVPPWMKKLFLVHLASFLGMFQTASTYKAQLLESSTATTNKSSVASTTTASSSKRTNGRKRNAQNKSHHQWGQNQEELDTLSVSLEDNGNQQQKQQWKNSPKKSFDHKRHPLPFTPLFQLQLLQHLVPTAFSEQAGKEELTEQAYAEVADAINYSREWIRLAEVFDRLFFWLFLAAIVLSTLALFLPLMFDLDAKRI
ncbi:hypothetical protein HELRODRAFT_173437 [Helobdella robusta]|uniref:Neurotransmitter-gated ion-channel ligand-binding domain-containing protein n=1 Tax=Helobdella robusta TaxID=6412 RepID=T1F6T7_HELRO|nr:hypothetical protein HELRODRAFT_173437 [Helobdella robusta]ESO03736.1 hypothetical protein HELRODRAFT_173437 [Helobdella robusta]